MQIDFTGKRVLVTGGTRGIGRCTVEDFLAAGARVALNGTTEESTGKALAELSGSDVIGIPGRVNTAAGCKEIVEAAVEGLGGLDILINNAGIPGPIVDTAKLSEADWDEIQEVNLKGVFFMSQHAESHLRASHGNIVNLSSTAALVASQGLVSYAAAKAGVLSLTKTHAYEFAPDVRVNAVVSGNCETDMMRAWAIGATGDIQKGYDLVRQGIALDRLGQVEELAAPILYLASDLASFVTGSVHVVDGGDTIF